MIHRRLNADDAKGVAEFLNEMDKFYNGITVFTTHYLFFTDGNGMVYFELLMI